MKRFNGFLAVICLAALMCGCTEKTASVVSGDEASSAADSVSSGQEASSQQESSSGQEASAGQESADSDAPASSGAAVSADCKITFSDSAVSAEGGDIKTDGAKATISRAGTYEIMGNCSDGQVIVDAGKDDKVTIILNGLDLTCKSGAPIYCINADTLTVRLADGSKNALADGGDYVLENGEDEPDAALFSKDDTVIEGGGELTVTANYKDGIKCKDTLKISGGNITVTSADDGITGKDSLEISGGSITVKSGGDGLKSTEADDETLGYITLDGGTYNIDADGDAVQAETKLTVNGGEYTVVTGGGSAEVEYTAGDDFGGGRFGNFNGGGRAPFDFDTMTDDSGNTAVSTKGFKAGASVEINGGTFNLDTADDSLHSVNVAINGGTLAISSGDDALHADDALTIKSGDINIATCYEGIEGKTIDISGGNISLTAYDDGLNAAGGDNGGMMGFGSEGSSDYYMNITSGDIVVNASGDGVDSNGDIKMSGGSLIIYGPTNSGNGALDYQMSFDLTGGTLIALGAVGMAQTPSSSTAPCIMINGDIAANSEFSVKDSDGNTVLSTVSAKSAQCAVISSPELKEGTEYTVYAGENVLSTFTAANGVTGGTTGGFGGGGGRPGGGRPGMMGF